MLRTVKIQDKNLEIKADRKLKADKTNPQHLGSSIPVQLEKFCKRRRCRNRKHATSHCRAMKMETTVVSKITGTVDKIYVQQGDTVSQDDLLISFHIAK